MADEPNDKPHRPGWRRHAIIVQVEGVAGAHITDIAEDIIALAKKLDTGVTCNVNGARMTAFPHTTLDQLHANYVAQTKRSD